MDVNVETLTLNLEFLSKVFQVINTKWCNLFIDCVLKSRNFLNKQVMITANPLLEGYAIWQQSH